MHGATFPHNRRSRTLEHCKRRTKPPHRFRSCTSSYLEAVQSGSVIALCSDKLRWAQGHLWYRLRTASTIFAKLVTNYSSTPCPCAVNNIVEILGGELLERHFRSTKVTLTLPNVVCLTSRPQLVYAVLLWFLVSLLQPLKYCTYLMIRLNLI